MEGSRACTANVQFRCVPVLSKVCKCSEKAGHVENALSVQAWHWSDLGREVVDFDNVVQLSGGLIQKPASLLSWGQQG